ncbi:MULTISPECIES: hypothetical protein [Rhizobium]|uniref:Uncharacterized protein n=1 Tax=Rhizobium phaseoli TaxID=396 RepID=A0A7X6F8L0_9HYPH|nr:MULTISPECIES: hypothetical protein [Rhizobium]MDE8763082.1 hypothetical protein [Rhizobium sp. CBK13]NKF13376.1 hypothetical protein [Rhizobium phaseoli]QPK13253.1 hypothetical protein HER27_031770 [Rhizobium phaseoli]
MRQQTKSFIVERKPSRKPKADAPKPSIWGKLAQKRPPLSPIAPFKLERTNEKKTTSFGSRLSVVSPGSHQSGTRIS